MYFCNFYFLLSLFTDTFLCQYYQKYFEFKLNANLRNLMVSMHILYFSAYKTQFFPKKYHEKYLSYKTNVVLWQ